MSVYRKTMLRGRTALSRTSRLHGTSSRTTTGLERTNCTRICQGRNFSSPAAAPQEKNLSGLDLSGLSQEKVKGFEDRISAMNRTIDRFGESSGILAGTEGSNIGNSTPKSTPRPHIQYSSEYERLRAALAGLKTQRRQKENAVAIRLARKRMISESDSQKSKILAEEGESGARAANIIQDHRTGVLVGSAYADSLTAAQDAIDSSSALSSYSSSSSSSPNTRRKSDKSDQVINTTSFHLSELIVADPRESGYIEEARAHAKRFVEENADIVKSWKTLKGRQNLLENILKLFPHKISSLNRSEITPLNKIFLLSKEFDFDGISPLLKDLLPSGDKRIGKLKKEIESALATTYSSGNIVNLVHYLLGLQNMKLRQIQKKFNDRATLKRCLAVALPKIMDMNEDDSLITLDLWLQLTREVWDFDTRHVFQGRDNYVHSHFVKLIYNKLHRSMVARELAYAAQPGISKELFESTKLWAKDADNPHIGLPVMLFRKHRKFLKNLPFIVVSDRSGSEIKRRDLNEGFDLVMPVFKHMRKTEYKDEILDFMEKFFEASHIEKSWFGFSRGLTEFLVRSGKAGKQDEYAVEVYERQARDILQHFTPTHYPITLRIEQVTGSFVYDGKVCRAVDTATLLSPIDLNDLRLHVRRLDDLRAEVVRSNDYNNTSNSSVGGKKRSGTTVVHTDTKLVELQWHGENVSEVQRNMLHPGSSLSFLVEECGGDLRPGDLVYLHDAHSIASNYMKAETNLVIQNLKRRNYWQGRELINNGHKFQVSSGASTQNLLVAGQGMMAGLITDIPMVRTKIAVPLLSVLGSQAEEPKEDFYQGKKKLIKNKKRRHIELQDIDSIFGVQSNRQSGVMHPSTSANDLVNRRSGDLDPSITTDDFFLSEGISADTTSSADHVSTLHDFQSSADASISKASPSKNGFVSVRERDWYHQIFEKSQVDELNSDFEDPSSSTSVSLVSTTAESSESVSRTGESPWSNGEAEATAANQKSETDSASAPSTTPKTSPIESNDCSMDEREFNSVYMVSDEEMFLNQEEERSFFGEMSTKIMQEMLITVHDVENFFSQTKAKRYGREEYI